MRKRKRNKNTKASLKKFFNTTSKILVWFVVLNGEIQIYLSYILAWQGKTDVLESLGQTIALEIIAPLGLLIIKAVVENIFEKNQIFPHVESAENKNEAAPQEEAASI